MNPKPTSWWIDFVLVNAVLLLAESARGVVLGTLWSYVQSLGGSAIFLATTVSIFSAGRLIASIIFGALSDHWSTRRVLVSSCVSCVIGNFLFVFCGNSWIKSKELLLVSRILTGFGTGVLSVARTHVSVTTPSDERTMWMSCLGIVQFAGFAVAPVVGSIDVEFNLGILEVNTFTFATFVLLMLESVLIVCLAMFMSNPSTADNNEADSQAEDVVVTIPSISAIEQPSSPSHSLGIQTSPHAYTQPIPYENQSRSSSGASTPSSSGHESFSFLFASPSANRLASPSSMSCSPASTSRSQPSGIRGEAVSSPRLHVGSGFASRRSSISESPTEEKTFHVGLLESDSQPSDPSDETLQTNLTKLKLLLQQCKVPMVFVMINLSGRGVLSVAETMGSQLYTQVTNTQTNDAPPDNVEIGPASNFFLVLGSFGLIVFLVMSKLTKYVNEVSLLLLAFISMGIGFGILIDFVDYDIDIYDFSAGMTLIWVIGTPISQTLSVSMLSKHFNSETSVKPVKGVGFWMGMVTAAGSIGRIIFPLIAGALYQQFGSSSALLFTSLVSFATCLLIFFSLDAWRTYTRAFRQSFSHFDQLSRDDQLEMGTKMSRRDNAEPESEVEHNNHQQVQ